MIIPGLEPADISASVQRALAARQVGAPTTQAQASAGVTAGQTSSTALTPPPVTVTDDHGVSNPSSSLNGLGGAGSSGELLGTSGGGGGFSIDLNFILLLVGGLVALWLGIEALKWYAGHHHKGGA